MRVVESSGPSLAEEIEGIPLSVVFAEGDAIEALRSRGEGTLPLVPPFHVSDADAYLVLPEDIGLELVDMFRDGDVDLLAEAMRDGLVALGTIGKAERAGFALEVERAARPEDLLRTLPYAESVGVGRGIDPVPLLNAMDHVQCTVASGFVDARGVAAMLAKPEHAAAVWRVRPEDKHLAHVEPTYAWWRRAADGSVGIECALFCEYEELVVVLRPARLVPLDTASTRPTTASASPAAGARGGLRAVPTARADGPPDAAP